MFSMVSSRPAGAEREFISADIKSASCSVSGFHCIEKSPQPMDSGLRSFLVMVSANNLSKVFLFYILNRFFDLKIPTFEKCF